MSEHLERNAGEVAPSSKWERLHAFLSDAALLNMSAEERERYQFNNRMDERLRQIEIAKAAQRSPIKLSEIIKGGYAAVGESAAGVIYRGR